MIHVGPNWLDGRQRVEYHGLFGHLSVYVVVIELDYFADFDLRIQLDCQVNNHVKLIDQLLKLSQVFIDVIELVFLSILASDLAIPRNFG